MRKRLFFDIETQANEDAVAMMPEPQAPANLKDQEKIAAAIAEKKQEMVNKAALDPDYGKILSLGYSTGGKVNVITYADGTERDILTCFWEALSVCDGFCVGYNILGFDLPYIMRRSMALGVKPPIVPLLARYRTEPVTDLMMLLYNWGADKYKPLKQVAKLYGLTIEMPDIDGGMVAALSLDDLVAYQKSDVRLVIELYERMNGVYFVHD